MSRPRRSTVLLLALLPVVWALAEFCRFRTDVEIHSDGERVLWTVNGFTVEATSSAPFESVEIHASPSIYPMGGRSLEIHRGGELLFQDQLPSPFSTSSAEFPGVGDWTIDERASTTVVYRRELDLTPPFSLRTSFTGRSLKGTSIRLLGAEGRVFTFRRGLINDDVFILSAGGELLASSGLPPRPQTRVRGVIETLLRGLFAAIALLVIFRTLDWLQARVGAAVRERRRRSGSEDPPAPTEPEALVDSEADHVTAKRSAWAPVALAILLAFAGFVQFAWVAGDVLEALPHLPDSVAYRLQARWIQAGKLYEEAPAFQENLQIPFTAFKDDRWIGVYPVGWPLLLAAGEVLGRAWLVAPLLGVAFMALLYAAGKEIFGTGVGLLACVLAVLSPMANIMFGSQMSHSAASVFVLLALWLLVRGWRCRSWLQLLLSGASLGYVLGIRPLTAVVLAIPLGLFSLLEWWTGGQRKRSSLLLGVLLAGGLLGSLPILLYNARITGHALEFTNSYAGGANLSLETLPMGFRHLDTTLAYTPPMAFGWGWGWATGWPVLALALGVPLVALLGRRPGRKEMLLAVAFCVIPPAHTLVTFHGLHGFGPRYYFEVFPCLFLLAARGLQLLARPFSVGSVSPPRLLGRPLSVGLLTALVLSAAIGLKSRLEMYRGYNGVSGVLEDVIEERGITRGLVLFGSDNWYPWGEAGSLLPADLREDLVFAQLRDDNRALFSFYDDRAYYLWQDQQLTDFHPPEYDDPPLEPAISEPPVSEPAVAELTPLSSLRRLDIEQKMLTGTATVRINDPAFQSVRGVLFDGDVLTHSRSNEINPLVITLNFLEPISLQSVRIFPTFSKYDWSLVPSQDHEPAAVRGVPSGEWSRIELTAPVQTTEVRLEVVRLERDDLVHVNEIEIFVSTEEENESP